MNWLGETISRVIAKFDLERSVKFVRMLSAGLEATDDKIFTSMTRTSKVSQSTH